MASVIDIKRALETQLNTYSEASSIRVSWESSDFTPEESETYLDPSFLPARPIQVELQGTNTKDRYEGIFQINVVQKKGLGIGSIDTQYEALIPYFNRGIALLFTTANAEDIIVELNRYYLGDLNEDSPPWAFKPLYIEWRCDLRVG